ncbi:MAG: SUF system NifU family Fe-S cluster assembly protein [SAR324 cluster bacterium]|nr:SUF system NifU family Fe-S cluster assembly protein [SAR324 cluster bacterium]
MSELSELYEEIILDHNKNPRHYNKIPEGTNRRAEGDNPLCGDHYKIHLQVEDGIVKSAGFEGAGCAISKASASLMLERVLGKTEAEIADLAGSVHQMLTGEETATGEHVELGKLEVLEGVCKYPMRVKCATLAWHTLNAALDDTEKEATTE